ncbi:MAG: cysteine--tRNA ligase [Parcubacteria group bacterium]|nr:MAG: cysteine--tRNA ligase [Parcubacteria group bacterium]
MTILLYNSLTRKKEEFKPISKDKVGIYSCGPTVYDNPHLGNMLPYIIWDVLKRYLLSQKYQVEHVMNITDVGHLTSDADAGQDKLVKASQKTGESAWDLAKKYSAVFFENMNELNILPSIKYLRATDTIREQIEFAQVLDKKGYLYRISDGMYFDTSKAKNYGQLGNLKNVDQRAGSRVDVNPDKKHPSDFAVWKFSPADEKRDMEWESPWGKGFPGWHLECSVMSRMTLGDTFDIHTGGLDHLTVHHPNEMAQSQAVTGKRQANYWLHNAFMRVDSGKMSKSLGTGITLQDIKAKGFSPAAFRLLVLQNHYRKTLNFTWESLEAAQRGLVNIIKEIAFFDKPALGCPDLEADFYLQMADDINSAKGLAVLQQTIESENPTHAKLCAVLKMDEVLGLGLKELRERALNLPPGAQELLEQRKLVRQAKDWTQSDKLRDKLSELGVEIRDTELGQNAVQVKL